MNDNTQTQFPVEGQPAAPIVDEENDNSADSSSEETTAESTQSSEGDENSDAEEQKGGEDEEKGNFADHPRWKEREDDWKTRYNDQEKRHSEDMQKILDKLDNVPQNDAAQNDIPSWFGGDDDQWKEFQSWNEGLASKTQETVQKGIEQKTQAEQKAIADATEYMNSQVDTIESDKALNPDAVKVDKNKLLKYTLDNELVDTQGRWNYRAAFKLMQANVKSVKANTVKEKKDVAGATVTEKNGAEPTKPEYTTTEDFNNPTNRPW